MRSLLQAKPQPPLSGCAHLEASHPEELLSVLLLLLLLLSLGIIIVVTISGLVSTTFVLTVITMTMNVTVIVSGILEGFGRPCLLWGPKH